MIKLLGYPPVGEKQHHSGWPYVLSGLRTLESPDGILLDDFTDRSFGHRKDFVPHTQPWVGMFHHPPDTPPWLPQNSQPRSYFTTRDWIKSEPHLKLAITFSNHNAEWLREHLPCPVAVLRHPIGVAEDVWTFNKWRRAKPRRLLQAGFYLRNTRAIYNLPPLDGLVRTRLWPAIRWIRVHDSMVSDYYRKNGGRVEYKGVEEFDRLENPEYAAFLCQHVVFMELLAAVANNVLLECIVRHTPVLVNRLPAVVEYLGPRYPLYYDDIAEVPKLLTSDLLRQANKYLRRMDKTEFQLETFIGRLQAILREHGLA